jgi:hypothetical protein
MLILKISLAQGLSHRLQEELKYEESSKFPEPDALEEFKKLGIWQVKYFSSANVPLADRRL